MRGRRGVTVLEVVVVLAIGTVVLGIFGGNFGGIQGRMAVHAAESRLMGLHHRARSIALEEGLPVRFVANPQTQTVTLREGCHGEGRIVASHDFNLSHRVDMLTSGGILEICMTPNGYAHPERDSFTRQGRITFLRGKHSSSIVLLPLGQVATP